jgi:succinoglycan biosynthesis protein ExoO
MPRSDCRVSIVIPLYNSASTLPHAVRSALSQTLRDIEVLIVDDGSRDTSLAEARAIAATDSRVRVIALPANRGKSHAMNRAIAQANGAWIAVLDADDWYEPDRLAALVGAGEAHDVALVADNQHFWDAAAGVRVRTAFPIERGDIVLTKQAFIAGSDPYADFDYGMLKPVIRTDCIRRFALAYHENARLSEDFMYLTDFFAAGETGFLIARPLYNWTQSFGTISRQWTLTGAGDWRYDYRSALAALADLHHLLASHDQPLADLLVARMRAFERLDRLTTLSRMRASGVGMPRILLAAARHPSIWPALAARILRA